MTRSGDLSLTTKGIFVVAIPVTALLAAMVVFYQFEQQAQNAEHAVEKTFEMRGEIRRVLTQTVNAETGIRGYLLTRRPSFLEPYEAALRELPDIRANLRRLAEDDPVQAQRIPVLDSLAAELLAALERSRMEVAKGDEASAIAALESDKVAMDRLRRELEEMSADSQRRLTERTGHAQEVERRTRAAILLAGGFGLLGGIAATLIFTRRIVRRVRNLEGAAREVGAGRRILNNATGNAELAVLERTLKETSDLLTDRAEELRRTQGELESRVEQRTAELKTANEELRASNEVREALVSSSPLAIWAVDLEGKVTFWNPAAERIFGWSEQEVIGSFLPIIPADQIVEFRGWLEQFAKGETFSGVERKRRRKAGADIDVMIWTAPLRDSEGRIRGAIAIDSDVSQQRSLEEQFRQSQKLEAVGRLAGGVAHDFNNMLTVIQGYTELLGMEVEGRPQLVEYTREIQYAADLATALTGQLLAFSRRQISQPKTLELNEVVERSLKLLRRVIGEDIEIVADLQPAAGKVKVDPVHIDQVIMNLVVNARDAMGNGGRLTIETSCQNLDAEYAESHLAVQPGRYALLAISDTGSGMTPETLSRLFEPFFTTKEAGKGTGLGLSIVYGIVKQNLGEIMVYSEPGHGTTFKIYLPAVDAIAEPSRARESAPAAPGSETILLCEDDQKIRELLEKMLARQGYRVLPAETPQEALRTARESSERIHLLLTDIVMPHMNGFELAEAVVEARPQTKVLYMSGYADNHMRGTMTIDQDVPFLQKPFTAAYLSEMVRQVLGHRGGATSHGGPP